MKITDNRGGSKIMFNDLMYGDLFEDNETNICIRITTISDDFISYNAVCLDGELMSFNNDAEVVKLNAELIIS